jgi:hypothetical protein
MHDTPLHTLPVPPENKHDPPMTRSELENKFKRDDAEARRLALSALTEHEHGRRFLWWLFQIGKALNNQPFSPDPYVTAFGCGEQNVGNAILSELTIAAPKGLTRLMEENAEIEHFRQEELNSIKEYDS